MAVVEVIMMERSADGVVKGRYALGWALLPLYQVLKDRPEKIRNLRSHGCLRHMGFLLAIEMLPGSASHMVRVGRFHTCTPYISHIPCKKGNIQHTLVAMANPFYGRAEALAPLSGNNCFGIWVPKKKHYAKQAAG
eukprot:scaffold207192_cov19-Tisochrysis_lutea.AAC.3